ncbi:hypothetical protein HanRHA438_Chr07g0300461 [Helianthus annuus]|nr:hypothetical protein HanIR_Chr07g0312711 [Helianthus annuus]KAJ0907559.1 hypothetical protein HanRHA438_Chr07g0300461 [Helianthus annuus]
MLNMSDQSSFCSSETTKACPNPSRSSAVCPYFCFSSNGKLKNSCVSFLNFSSNEKLTS